MPVSIANKMKLRGGMSLVWPLLMLAAFLFGRELNDDWSLIREFQTLLLSADEMLIVCLAAWCGTLIFLTFSRKDWPLAGLLIIATATYFARYATQSTTDVAILLASITLGKGVRRDLIKNRKNDFKIIDHEPPIKSLLVGLIVLLAFSSCWHLEVARNFYPGTRWTGLCDNPNTYGMLMGAGSALAFGLFAGKAKSVKGKSIRVSWSLTFRVLLWIAIFMMGVGLVMSYSRGAWVAVSVALAYLAWCHGKLKWWYVVVGVGLVALVAGLVWSRTPDSAPWYVKRTDLGRPSAQHRMVAWKAGLKIMRDHPFGVGWNNAVSAYEKSYSPPEDGADALITNDYMMIGTELGIPALVCLFIYAAFCLRGKPGTETEAGRIQAACRAGAIVFMVAFWFDGGLFKLATAALFWVLLELGSGRWQDQ